MSDFDSDNNNEESTTKDVEKEKTVRKFQPLQLCISSRALALVNDEGFHEFIRVLCPQLVSNSIRLHSFQLHF